MPKVLLLLRSPFGLPPQQQRDRYPWRRFHLIPCWKLSSAWGQADNTPVENGELVLYRDHGYLKDGKQIKVVRSGGVAAFDFVQNETFDLKDVPGQNQIVDVVLARRIATTYLIAGSDESTKTPLKVTVCAQEPTTGKVTRSSVTGLGAQLVLPPGQYVLLAWCPGYRLAKRTVQATKEEAVQLEILMREAPHVKGTILGLDGNPMANATVGLRYLKAAFLDASRAKVTEDGGFDLPVDDSLSPLLEVMTVDRGSCVVDLTKV